ncbi:MAG: aryl-sulfate sulfotransferase, partial [Bacteroidetes bacterium]
FGRERGDVFYSHNISDVDLLPQTGNRLICPGNIEENGVREARIVEVAHPSGEVVFEAVIDFANLFSNGGNWGQSDIVYRCERLPLLPDVQ